MRLKTQKGANSLFIKNISEPGKTQLTKNYPNQFLSYTPTAVLFYPTQIKTLVIGI